MGVNNQASLQALYNSDPWKDIVNPKLLITLLATPSLRFLWPLQERSGTAVADFSGNGRTGTYSTPILGFKGPSHRVDGVCKFNGSSDVITAAAGCSIRGRSAITFFGIINVSGTAAIRGLWWESTNVTTSNSRCFIQIQADHTLKISMRAGLSTDTSITCTTDAALAAGGHMIHISVNVATNAIVIYVDGAPVAATIANAFSQATISDTAPSAGPFMGGQQQVGSVNNFYDSTMAYWGLSGAVVDAATCLAHARAAGFST